MDKEGVSLLMENFVIENNDVYEISLEPSMFGALSNIGIKFLREREIDYKLAINYGVTEYDYSLFLPCYDKDLNYTGGQIRFIDRDKNKYLTIRNKNSLPPTYSLIPRRIITPSETIILCESILDGLSLASNFGCSSIAMLGTKISEELGEYLITLTNPIIIIPDKDAIDWANTVRDMLFLFKKKVSVFYVEDKPYRLTGEEKKKLKSLVTGY